MPNCNAPSLLTSAYLDFWLTWAEDSASTPFQIGYIDQQKEAEDAMGRFLPGVRVARIPVVRS